jgi:hypothetical protein
MPNGSGAQDRVIGRRRLIKSGLGIGISAVGISAIASAATPRVAKAATAVSGDTTFTLQYGWMCCGNCFSLYWPGADGACAWKNQRGEDGTHVPYYDTVYGVPTSVSSTANVQSPWNYCDLCGGLQYGPDEYDSHCPGNGSTEGVFEQHDTGTTTYYLPYGSWSGTDLQSGWRYCDYCRVLFWGSQQPNSCCPRPTTSANFNHTTIGVVSSATNYYLFMQ